MSLLKQCVIILLAMVLTYNYGDAAEQSDTVTHKLGSTITMGIALGGGGVAGVPFRVHMTERTAIEVAVIYYPTATTHTNPLFPETESVSFYNGSIVTGGLDLYFSKHYCAQKERLHLNGMFIKGGVAINEVGPFSLVAFGWVYEQFRIRKKKYSLSLELGPGIQINQKKHSDDLDKIKGILYLKAHWTWVLTSGLARMTPLAP